MSMSKGARRVCEVLDYVAQSQSPPSSRQIFEHLATPRSSGYDLLRSLVERQYLQPRAGGQWILGEEIQALALSRFGLGNIAAEITTVLSALQEETQEIAQLTVLNRSKVLITHVFDSLRSMRVVIDVGTEVPVNWTASGRLLAMGLGDEDLQRFCVASSPAVQTEKEIVDCKSFIREVREAASRGHAIESEPMHPQVCSIAAPVSNRKGHCIAAVSLVLPVDRMRNSRDTLTSLVCAAAAKLTHSLVDRA